MFLWCTKCEYEENCQLRTMAPDLDGCSGHSKLHHRFTEKKEKMQKEAEKKVEKQLKNSLANEQVLASVKVGDKVKLMGSTIWLGLNLPRYLDNGVFTVLGFTRNGKVKCDWDGGRPFNIPPGCLELLSKE